MVLAVLNSHPSPCHPESFSAERFFVAPQRSTRRSRAHNIPGGIKHLLSDPKRRRRISARSTALPFSFAPQPISHRSHPRLTRLHHKASNPVAQKTLPASATPASEGQSPQSPSQPQSHASVPVDVTFPRRLPELPRKQISPEVLASLGYTPEVPSQYIRDQMERLAPMYVFDLFCHTTSLSDILVLECIRLCGPQRQLSQGQRCPRHSPSTSMGKLQHQCLPHIWQRYTLLLRLVRSHGVS
jgi:hypothetical protein